MRRQFRRTNHDFNFTALFVILILIVVTGSCAYMIHALSVGRKAASANEDKEYIVIVSEDTQRLREAEHEIDSLRAEKNKAEDEARQYKIRLDELKKENARLKESERKALIAKSKAENEADLLKSEKESAEDTARRYKTQLDAVRKENERLKSETVRLTKKLDNSLVRIANPFK